MALTRAARKRLEIQPPMAIDEDPAFQTNEIAGIATDRLRAFVERIERLKIEIAALQADVREVKAEAKGNGFDVKVLNHVIKLRAQDADDLAEFDDQVDLYKRALGMPE